MTGGGVSGDVTVTVSFASSGAATTVARSDHNHSGVYAPVSHTHAGEDITSGTLSTSRYSAYSDLGAEGYLDNNADGDLPTRLQADGRYVNEGQADSVTTGMITNGTILFADVGQNGCSAGQIIKWNGSAWACAADDTGSTAYWALGGNAGTTPGTHFVGTTDNQALQLHVNGARALRLEPNTDSPNLIGGYSGNSVTAGVAGATIGGGGRSSLTNRVTDNYGTVGGGTDNQAGDGGGSTSDSSYATVGGGGGNTASGDSATIGGGAGNTASGDASTIGGGANHIASGWAATIGGGWLNSAAAAYATIAGGGPSDTNDPTNSNNRVTDDYGAIGGGGGNRAGNGDSDTTNARYATVGGGYGNTASNDYTTVGGGWLNTASNNYATVGGGYRNDASGGYATVPGGYENTAGGACSFAAGAQAQAAHNGSFVWSSAEGTSSWGNNTFTVRAHGGVRFYSAYGTGTGVQLAAGGGSWSNLSDRAMKENFAPVDGRDTLDRLAAVPIQTWNYRSQDPAIRHIGPVAQDFYAAFGVGEDDTHITTVDADGVALAAIQGLYEMVQEKDARIAELEGRVAALEAQNAAQQAQIDNLEARLQALEQRAGGTPSTTNALPLYGLALGGLAVLGVVAYRQREGGRR